MWHILPIAYTTIIKIPLDYTRVEVHTMKPEFMLWRIDYATPEGLVLHGDVMGQFIIWHK